VPVKAPVARKAEVPRHSVPATGEGLPRQPELLDAAPTDTGIDGSVDDLEF
jgi:hypothetical protein